MRYSGFEAYLHWYNCSRTENTQSQALRGLLNLGSQPEGEADPGRGEAVARAHLPREPGGGGDPGRGEAVARAHLPRGPQLPVAEPPGDDGGGSGAGALAGQLVGRALGQRLIDAQHAHGQGTHCKWGGAFTSGFGLCHGELN